MVPISSQNSLYCVSEQRKDMKARPFLSATGVFRCRIFASEFPTKMA